MGLKDIIWCPVMLKSKLLYLHPCLYVNHLHTMSTCFTHSYKDFILSNECLTLITLIAFYFDISYVIYLMLRIIFMSYLLCFPPLFFLLLVCLMLLCLRMHVCMSVCVCVCMHAFWHGDPEEEGRPRRRRTPRFLLKPWTRSRQANESRLGLQVKKTRRELEREYE